MKRRFIIGLVTIFAVVLIGGGLVSNIMGQLYKVNTARFLIDQVYNTLTSLDLMVVKTIKDMKLVQYTENDIRALLKDVEAIQNTMVDLNGLFLSRNFAATSCGVCHEGPEKLTRNLYSIASEMETIFSDMTMLTNAIITGRAGVGYDRILSDIELTFHNYHEHLDTMRNILIPMTMHINEEVGYNIVKIKKTHDAMVILTTLLVLIGILVLATAMTRPIRSLNEGTEAIVKAIMTIASNLRGMMNFPFLPNASTTWLKSFQTGKNGCSSKRTSSRSST